MNQKFYLFLCVKNLSLLVFRLPELLLLEVSISQGFGDLDAGNVHLGGCGNAEFLVSSAQGNSVDCQGTWARGRKSS